MSPHPFARLGSARAGLVPPVLLFLLVQTPGCGAEPVDAAAALSFEFPRHAPAVLGSGRGFSPSAGGFVAAATPAERVHVELPADGGEAIVFRGANGFEAQVREIGAAGAGKLVDHALAYRRQGGASFWTTAPHGVEEWLHVPRASGGPAGDRPVAVWQIAGARLRARGAAVELVGADGMARVRVTAPVAYAAGGRRVDVRLRIASPWELGPRTAGGTSTLELYADGGGEALLVDPMWIAAGSMSSPRYDHASARLGNGKVLASGGSPGVTAADALITAELYDPTADAWANVGPMGAAHVCHTATALTDGTVLIAGGFDATDNIENIGEIYDATKGWTFTGLMSWSHMNHTANRLPDGRVLVAGGLGNPIGIPGAKGPPTVNSLGSHTTCWNFGGGGCGGPGAINVVEIYDPVLQTWSLVAPMNQHRQRHTATSLADGKVLVAGGEDFGFAQSGFEIYDPTLDAWQVSQASLLTARADHTATLLPNGDVLLAGGQNNNSLALASAEIFHAGTWMPAKPMSTPRVHHTATPLPDGTVLVAGGSDGNQSLSSAEIFDPVTQTWALAAPMSSPHSEHTATTLANGEVLVAAGEDALDASITLCEIYVPTLPDGSPCTTPSQCQSGFCAGGLCCSSACQGPCQTCSKAAGAVMDGQCTPTDGVVCDQSPCKVSGVCNGGTCTAATPKVCAPSDACHQPGTCDPSSGTCSIVAKLDGSPCPNGICIAGSCVPDPNLGATSSSSGGGGSPMTGGTTTGSGSPGMATGTGGASGTGAAAGAQLTGNGCSTSGPPVGGAPAGLLVALLAALHRRRGRGARPAR